MRMIEWFVEMWWEIVDVHDRTVQWLLNLRCELTQHNFIAYGHATDLEPRYWCDRCGKEHKI